jgi:hypothetical protein
VKTTLELPDDLMRTVKIRAAREDRTLKDVIAELLQRGLESPSVDDRQPGHRVVLPLILGTSPADPADEVTPDRAAELLLADEAAGAS